MLADITTVANEYCLPQDQLHAIKEVFRFKHNGTSEPGKDADPVVQVGAHPVGALMAVHVLQAEYPRAQRAASLG